MAQPTAVANFFSSFFWSKRYRLSHAFPSFITVTDKIMKNFDHFSKVFLIIFRSLLDFNRVVAINRSLNQQEKRSTLDQYCFLLQNTCLSRRNKKIILLLLLLFFYDHFTCEALCQLKAPNVGHASLKFAPKILLIKWPINILIFS